MSITFATTTNAEDIIGWRAHDHEGRHGETFAPSLRSKAFDQAHGRLALGLHPDGTAMSDDEAQEHDPLAMPMVEAVLAEPFASAPELRLTNSRAFALLRTLGYEPSEVSEVEASALRARIEVSGEAMPELIAVCEHAHAAGRSVSWS